MKRLFCLAVVVFLCLSAGILQAEPVEVVLYPDSARIQEETTLDVSRTEQNLPEVVFTIPYEADPNTVTVTVGSGADVVDISFEDAAIVETEEVRTLREQIKNLEKERSRIQARRESALARIGFWTSLKDLEADKAQEIIQTAEAMGKSIRELHEALFDLDREEEELNRRLSLLQDELNRMTGPAERMRRVHTVFSGKTPQSLKVRYAYDIHNCGWSPKYRLEAKPKEEIVDFSFDAEIRQDSGRDWQDVELSLATLRPRVSLEPPPLRNWVISPEPRPDGRVRARSMKMEEETAMMAADSAPAAFKAKAPPAPQSERFSTFTMWRLGKRSIPAGKNPRITLKQTKFSANFQYTLRPGRSPDAYLTARLTWDKGADLPPGQALFLVDGALLGTRHFSAEEDEKDVFFGSDPSISATMDLKEKKSGEKGLFGGKQTYIWSWEIEVANHNTFAAAVRVEEPEPQARDERIEIEIESNPEAEKDKEHVLFWEFELPAGNKKKITHTVRLKAPDEMELQLGR